MQKIRNAILKQVRIPKDQEETFKKFIKRLQESKEGEKIESKILDKKILIELKESLGVIKAFNFRHSQVKILEQLIKDLS